MSILPAKRDIDEAKIISLYSDNKYSMLKISKLMKCNSCVVKRVLRENNIKIRDNSEYKCKKVDEHFF